MENNKNATLETDRLILRKIQKSDAADMFKNYCNDEDVAKFLPWYTHGSLKNTKKYVKSLIKKARKNKGHTFHWVIVLKETNEVVGAIEFGKYDDVNLNCELGYCSSKSCWNKGIMTEAAAAAVKYMFESTNIERIYAIHAVENIGSGRVMQKIGMTKEGTLRHARICKGKFLDFDTYAIIRSDYEK